MSLGKNFEAEVSKAVTQYLKDKTGWNYNSNTPAPVCDHMALIDGRAYLLEAKEVRSLKIPFTAVSQNERKHLAKWYEAEGLAAILVKYVATGGRSRAWWMPWGDWLQMEEEAGFDPESTERRKRGTASASLQDGQRPKWFRPIRKIDRVDSYGHSLGSCWDLTDIFENLARLKHCPSEADVTDNQADREKIENLRLRRHEFSADLIYHRCRVLTLQNYIKAIDERLAEIDPQIESLNGRPM